MYYDQSNLNDNTQHTVFMKIFNIYILKILRRKHTGQLMDNIPIEKSLADDKNTTDIQKSNVSIVDVPIVANAVSTAIVSAAAVHLSVNEITQKNY